MKNSGMAGGIALGAAGALLAMALWGAGPREARAQGAQAAAGGHVFLATNNGNNVPVLFIIDPTARRFAMYTQRNPQSPAQFRLYVARNYSRDLEFDDLPEAPNGHTVEDIGRRLRETTRSR